GLAHGGRARDARRLLPVPRLVLQPLPGGRPLLHRRRGRERQQGLPPRDRRLTALPGADTPTRSPDIARWRTGSGEWMGVARRPAARSRRWSSTVSPLARRPLCSYSLVTQVRRRGSSAAVAIENSRGT